MNIQLATIKNFMGIKLVEIAPDGAVVQLAGGNGQGKTSAMLAVIGALGGKKALAKAMGLSADPGDDAIIKRGEEMAEVVVEFGGWVVTWQRERGKSDKVEIRGVGGGAHGRKKLGELIGAIAFDPLEFNEMSPGGRRATLLDLVGVNLEEIDSRRATVYQRRRDANTAHKLALARVGDAIEGAPKEVVDTLELVRRHEKESNLINLNADARYEAKVLRIRSDGARHAAGLSADHLSDVTTLLEQLARQHDDEKSSMALRHEVEVGKARAAEAKAKADDSERNIAADESAASAKEATDEAAKLVDPDLGPIAAEIEAGREANELYRLAQEREERMRESTALGVRSSELTTELEDIDAEKVALLDHAKMPIEGLGVSDDDATIDGHLWETTEFSRRLRVCVAISAALSGELRIAFVRSGNDLDEESYAAFCAECGRLGLQPWVERIVPGAGAIVIESGLVAS